jgi:molybdate transport system substrate-binding protein
MKRRWWAALTLLIPCGTLAGAAETSLRIAAASNLQVVVDPLQAAFERAHPGVQLAFSFGSSGNLVAQIRHGAPFDVLLSADLTYPATLVKSGHAATGSVETFAYGQLMLWPRPDTENWPALLRSASVRRIAIAQPDTAPFGIAARQALRAANLWAVVERRIIYGENVAQTLHFAESGNVDYAFVAASLLVGRPQLGAGLPIALPPTALAHGVVVITGRPHLDTAARFVAWLRDDAAQEILAEHGYRLP